MARYSITIEYDGNYFVGWQRQNDKPTVQKKIEDAIKNFSGEEVLVYGAGRTDSGVHAFGQVAHFDLNKVSEVEIIKNAINHFVKPYISIIFIEKKDDKFHARFDATKKRYIYKIMNRDSQLALMRNYAWLVTKEIDLESMVKASEILVGYHDFSSFRASSCQAKNPLRAIDRINISKHGDLIEVSFEAKSFLHNQVRIMTSALKNIGIGKWTYSQLQKVLEAKDRKLGPETAPPHGLYLDKVWYL